MYEAVVVAAFANATQALYASAAQRQMAINAQQTGLTNIGRMDQADALEALALQHKALMQANTWVLPILRRPWRWPRQKPTWRAILLAFVADECGLRTRAALPVLLRLRFPRLYRAAYRYR